MTRITPTITRLKRHHPADYLPARLQISADDYPERAQDLFAVHLYETPQPSDATHALALLLAKGNAWDSISDALEANAHGRISAADVCAQGFSEQEQIQSSLPDDVPHSRQGVRARSLDRPLDEDPYPSNLRRAHRALENATAPAGMRARHERH